MKMTFTNSDLKEMVLESIHKILIETNSIRPWTDDDWKNVNPLQVKDVDFEGIKDMDDEYNEKEHKTGKNKINTAKSMYAKPKGISKDKIDKYQNDLTKSIQQKYMDDTNRTTTIIPYDELGTIGGETLKAELKKNGLNLEIAGQTFAYGNTKLPENTMIVNITSGFNCPAAKLGECPFAKYCYGLGCERLSKELQIKNLRNQMAYKYMSTKELLKLVETYIEQAPVRIKYIRISEEGDFPNQEAVDFCDKLAGHLQKKYGILTTAYTHRQLNYSNIKYMKINMSSYDIKNGDRYFIALDKKLWDKVPEGLVLNNPTPLQGIKTNATFKCHCDCRKCNFCYQTKQQNGEPEEPVTVVEVFRK